MQLESDPPPLATRHTPLATPSRCAACPVPAGKPCLGETPRFAAFCAWADAGDPVKLAHIVNRSAIAETGPPGGGSPAFPPLMEQAGNLAAAAVTAVASGGKPATPEERERRLAICAGCEHFVDGRCTQCGCRMRWKVKLAAWRCPIGKF